MILGRPLQLRIVCDSGILWPAASSGGAVGGQQRTLPSVTSDRTRENRWSCVGEKIRKRFSTQRVVGLLREAQQSARSVCLANALRHTVGL